MECIEKTSKHVPHGTWRMGSFTSSVLAPSLSILRPPSPPARVLAMLAVIVLTHKCKDVGLQNQPHLLAMLDVIVSVHFCKHVGLKKPTTRFGYARVFPIASWNSIVRNENANHANARKALSHFCFCILVGIQGIGQQFARTKVFFAYRC